MGIPCGQLPSTDRSPQVGLWPNGATLRSFDRFPGDLGYCLHLLIGLAVVDVDHGGWLSFMGRMWAMVDVERCHEHA